MFDLPLNLLHHLSKIFLLGIPRKHFEILQESKDEYRIESSSKNTFNALLLSLGASLLFIAFSIELMLNDFSTENFATISIVLLVHFLVSFLGFRHLLWLINGKHIIEITASQLIISYEGTFLVKEKVIELDRIKSLNLEEEPNSTFEKIQKNIQTARNIIFYKTLGQILFETTNGKVKVFSNLSVSEKKEVINLFSRTFPKLELSN